MDTQNKMRNMATKIMAMLMSAIYLTVSINVPVLAYDEELNESIHSGDHGDILINNSTGIDINNGNSYFNTASADSLTVNNDSSGQVMGISAFSSTGPYAQDSATATIKNDFVLTSDNPTTNSTEYTTGIHTASANMDPTLSCAPSNVDIGGNATITENNTNNRKTIGIDAYSEGGGTTSNITIGENLSVTSAGTGTTTGINASTDRSGVANITVGNLDNHTGDLTVTGAGNVTGIDTTRIDNATPLGTSNINVGGNVTVEGQSRATGVNANADDHKETDVAIGGNLTVTNNGTSAATGIKTQTRAGGAVNVSVGNLADNTGNVTVTSAGNVTGIKTSEDGTTPEGNTIITVGGDVTANSTGNSYTANGVYIINSVDNAEVNIDIGGHVDATSGGGANGIEISSSGSGATTSINIGKGVSASGDITNGIYLGTSSTADININVGKDSNGNAITVQSSNDDTDYAPNSNGIFAQLRGEYTTAKINVEGNIVVNGEADGVRGIYANGYGGADTTLKAQIKGDVTSNGAAIDIEDMQVGDSVDIVVDGTVRSTADGIPVVIMDSTETYYRNVSVTAWKIESNEGTALLGKTNGVQTLTNDNSQNAVANCISYIIRVTQPEINNTSANVLSLTNADGTAWNKKKEWDNGEGVDSTMLDVAGENERVYVKLDVPAGYQLIGVYADAEKTVALNQDENGSYYLIVPRGGGIDVNVALTLIQTDPNPNPNPNPNPSPNPQPSPGPQPSPNPQPSPANPGYPSVITVPVVQYANNARLSSTMAMPNIAIPNIANANEMHKMVSIISGTPMGGTAMLAVTGDRFDASVVAALLSRRDINVNIACFVNGRLSLIVIPANADLTGVIEADGSIKIARLADTFGSTSM